MNDSEAELELGEDAAWIAAAVVLFACLGGGIVLAEWPLGGVTPDVSGEPNVVEPTENGTELWPYTARARNYESRTLGINVIFYGDPTDTRTALTERSALEWEEEQPHEGDADSDSISPERIEIDPEADDFGDVVSWSDAEGSTRYTYFDVDGEDEWLDESYQLHAGTYLGERVHIRAYEDPAGEWTAVQIHEEHWDWFRLRHTVTGISDSQRELESEFMGEPYTETVVRMPFENETADSDGWVSGIYFVAAALSFVVAGIVGRSRYLTHTTTRTLRRRGREIALGAALFALYTSIRWLGIAGEVALSEISPKVVAAPLYLALVFGTPGIAFLLGKETNGVWAFTFAVMGLGTAIVVDFAAMGTTVLPLRVVLHRGSILLSVGLIAYGGAWNVSHEDLPAPLVAGIAGWILAVGTPLLGYI